MLLRDETLVAQEHPGLAAFNMRRDAHKQRNKLRATDPAARSAKERPT